MSRSSRYELWVIPAATLDSSALNHFDRLTQQATLDAKTILGLLLQGHIELEQILSISKSKRSRFSRSMYEVLDPLFRAGQIHFSADKTGAAVYEAQSHRCVSPHKVLKKGVRYVLSRFTALRRVEDVLILENPLSHGRVVFNDSDGADFLGQLAQPKRFSDNKSKRFSSMLNLLVAGGFVVPLNKSGHCHEDLDQSLRTWEFHDLYFHAASRVGRHDRPVGGTFRFGNEPEPPAIKPNPWRDNPIPLPGPGLQPKFDLFDDVRYARRSIRAQAPVALSKQQLGDFLYQVGFTLSDGPYIKRPYPAGGGLFELELYVLIDRCIGIAPGYYYYSGVEHTLFKVQSPRAETEQMLYHAMQASGSHQRPQVVLTIASRFARVAYKYESMAYALQLKDCGVLIDQMYLVATKMGLSPCALGTGDSDLFASITGLAYTEEGSIGEFMIGR